MSYKKYGLMVPARLLEAAEEAKKREIEEEIQEREKFKSLHPDITQYGENKPLAAHGKNSGIITLERRLGIYHNSFYRAYKGISNLELKNMIKLAQYTGVSIDYLLGLDDRKFLTGREPKC